MLFAHSLDGLFYLKDLMVPTGTRNTYLITRKPLNNHVNAIPCDAVESLSNPRVLDLIKQAHCLIELGHPIMVYCQLNGIPYHWFNPRGVDMDNFDSTHCQVQDNRTLSFAASIPVQTIVAMVEKRNVYIQS